MKFGKLVLAIFMGHYVLQTLKVSGDLGVVMDFLIETPWNTPKDKPDVVACSVLEKLLITTYQEVNYSSRTIHMLR